MVHIDASTLNSTEIIENIAEGGADIGFIESENTHEKIIRIPMSNDELIVVSKDASLASEHRYIDQLFDRKWLLREEGSGTRSVFLAGLGDISGKLPVFMEYHDFEELKTLLHSNGDMITCISRHAVAGELALGTLHQVPLINLTFTRQFYLIHHRDKYLGKIVQNFMDLAVNFQPL
jgi:DNA-binding transcriptional LysR family regulator